MPIVVLFYQSNNLGMKEVLFLQGVYSVAIVIFEIPSGYFADILGRRTTLITGSILGTLGFALYSIGHGFWIFLFAEVVLGIGQSFISGADSAILYDSLICLKKEDKYLKYEGRLISIGNFAEAIAAIGGGLLAEMSLRTPYYFQIGIAFIAIPASILMTEPLSSSKKLSTSFRHILKIVKFSLISNKRLRWNLFYSAIIGASTLTMAWFIQPYLKYLDISPAGIGILWSLLNLSVGITAFFAWKIERMIGKKTTILSIALLVAGFYIIVSLNIGYFAIIIFFLFYLVRGVATPVLKDYINKITESEIRATVLSIRNFVIRINFAIIGPFLGWYTDAFSLRQALFLAGILFLTLGTYAALMFMIVQKNKVISYFENNEKS